jgi:hypothetical protein
MHPKISVSPHSFRISSRTDHRKRVSRFEYDGFSSLLVDPWRESWPEYWYSRDDV